MTSLLSASAFTPANRLASKASQASARRAGLRATATRCAAGEGDAAPKKRREFVLNSSSALVLASVFNFEGERPRTLGLRKYGDNYVLGLCPPSPNCVSTAEEANDPSHYIPAWTYDVGGRKNKSMETAIDELVRVIESEAPDDFTSTIKRKEKDYIYVEYKSPFFGFVDDVEFYFPGDAENSVEYRSASRLGESDANINRKRIKALRVALASYGWKSKGF